MCNVTKCPERRDGAEGAFKLEEKVRKGERERESEPGEEREERGEERRERKRARSGKLTCIAVTTRSGGGGETDCARSCETDPNRARSSFTFNTVFSSGMRRISASSKAAMHFS